MTEADVIQPSASIASTGLGIRYIGQHAYALSGTVSASFNTETTLLEFTSGAGVYDAIFSFGINDVAMDSATAVEFFIYYNDILSFYRRDEIHGGTGVTKSATMVVPVPLIIPPLTDIKISGLQTDGTAHDMYAMLTGRVYGAT